MFDFVNPVVLIVGLLAIGGGVALKFFVFKPKQLVKTNEAQIPTTSIPWASVSRQADVILESVGAWEPDEAHIVPDGKYPAAIIDIEKNARYECKLDKPLGRLFFFAPGCDISGWKYYVKLVNGRVRDFEPWNEEIKSCETPAEAYDLTHWPEAETYWSLEYSIWHDVKTWLLGAFIFGTFLFVLVTVAG